MVWSSSRVLVTTSLVVGLLAGCARSHRLALPTPRPSPGVRSNDVDRIAPGQPIEQLLMDRFPGVEVQSRPGGGVMMRIRGPSSFYSSNDPLLVVDGVAFQAGPDGLAWLNPHDIAGITVLKNPVETAIYGIRGANGVIVITTKVSLR